MKRALCILLLLSTVYRVEAQQDPSKAMFDSKAAERFANLALACVHKEYPNHISHTLNSDADVAPPRKLTPAFYGCYDWHSSVHGHWLLVRLIRTFPDAGFVQAARDALRQSLTSDNITQEAAYLRGPGRASFERPYGLAWLLQLAAELREWNDPQSKEIAANLRPLEQVVLERLNAWLPKLSNPVRIGEHDQTAFGLGLILDYAGSAGDQKLVELLLSKAKQFYLNDKNCPLAYEPSGEDFLSPCLGEADLMRRVLPSGEFAAWLSTFMPQISVAGAAWLEPVVSPDPSDPKLAHLDGLNLSRAWMLNGIASALPNNDERLAAIKAAAKAHERAGLAAVTGEHYEGGHWLGSFAVYLVTQRGIPAPSQANHGTQRSGRPYRRGLLENARPAHIVPVCWRKSRLFIGASAMSFLLNQKKIETAAGVSEETGSSKPRKRNHRFRKGYAQNKSSRQRGRRFAQRETGSVHPIQAGGSSAMHHVRQENLPFVGSSHEFVGAEQGRTDVSVFLFQGKPGSGPGPHRHPYDEIQFVREGRGVWTVNGETFEAGAGDIFVIKAGEIHSFKAIGDSLLIQVDVHLSPRFIQENL